MYCFSVQYLRQPTERSRLKYRLSLNSTSFIGGYVFCTSNPSKRTQEWQKTLSVITTLKDITPTSFKVGTQELEWIDPAEYKRRFNVDWVTLNSCYSEIAAVQLFCDDLSMVENFFRKKSMTHNVLFIPPDSNTGYAFQVRKIDSKGIFSDLQKMSVYK